ncbi:MAG: cytochrome c3 family protein [Burkholderiales bacterium]|jgi:fumarate reductase flavoprotein subunit|nr:cytochrome c3 family protein [Burkholderiales bacterium]
MCCKTLKTIKRGLFGACLIFAAMGLVFSSVSAKEPQSSEDTGLILKSTIDTANPAHLAGIHKGNLKLDCKACHGESLIPDDNATKVNESCTVCHGGFAKMATETQKTAKNPNINVHGSHLGQGQEIGCTVCHRGHEPSQAYCVHCHTNFELPIAGGAAKQ